MNLEKLKKKNKELHENVEESQICKREKRDFSHDFVMRDEDYSQGKNY